MVRENPTCEKGCFDRDGEPGCIVKCCAPLPTYVHYEGCNGCAIIGFIFQAYFCLYVTFCWTPTLAPKTGGAMMIGGPVMAAPVVGMAPAYGQDKKKAIQMM